MDLGDVGLVLVLGWWASMVARSLSYSFFGCRVRGVGSFGQFARGYSWPYNVTALSLRSRRT